MIHLRVRLGVAGAAGAVALAAFIPMAAADDPLQPDHGAEPDASLQEGTGAPSFNESGNCGAPGTSNPLATTQGWLTGSEPVRGYKGGFFGRTIGDISGRLVNWVVPMSGGNTIKVHARALPAFQRVTQNLAAETQQGRFYQVKLTTGAGNQTWGYAARTVGGSYSISHHALGTTIDINAPSNPYRADGVLVTDMPTWFVNAWKNAGFCWGGDWGGVKDPMHFSWMGPNHTPNYGVLPKPYAPKTTATNFGKISASYDLPAPGVVANRPYLVGDITGNGLPDVVGVADHASGTTLEYSRTNRPHLACAAGTTAVPGLLRNGRTPLLGDRQGKGGRDLWLLDTGGQRLGVEVAFQQGGYRTRQTTATTIVNQAGDVHLLADHNRDGDVDLYVVRRTATATRVSVFSGADHFATKLVDTATPLGDTRSAHFAIGDRTVNGSPDLYVASGTTIRILHHGYSKVSETVTGVTVGNLLDLGVGDYDGDGRDDLFLLRSDGRLTVRLGNVPLAGSTLTSWFLAPNATCSKSSTQTYRGMFRDDDDSVHEDAIEHIGTLGITKGCNPPVNDRFCPDADVTRGQMAAFLVRALALPPASRDHFVDDAGNQFQDAINRLASAGVTRGCNPPANDRFCPNDRVTRGQMAAFLVRGFALRTGAVTNQFDDDNGHVFEADINVLGTSGVTRGCNPPANTRYCPNRNVTRAQMASFLTRALNLSR